MTEASCSVRRYSDKSLQTSGRQTIRRFLPIGLIVWPEQSDRRQRQWPSCCGCADYSPCMGSCRVWQGSAWLHAATRAGLCLREGIVHVLDLRSPAIWSLFCSPRSKPLTCSSRFSGCGCAEHHGCVKSCRRGSASSGQRTSRRDAPPARARCSTAGTGGI